MKTEQSFLRMALGSCWPSPVMARACIVLETGSLVSYFLRFGGWSESVFRDAHDRYFRRGFRSIKENFLRNCLHGRFFCSLGLWLRLWPQGRR